jgi:uncharacterized ferredoxin-like protein
LILLQSRALCRTLSIHTLCEFDIPYVSAKVRRSFCIATICTRAIDYLLDANIVSVLRANDAAVLLGVDSGGSVALECSLRVVVLSGVSGESSREEEEYQQGVHIQFN